MTGHFASRRYLPPGSQEGRPGRIVAFLAAVVAVVGLGACSSGTPTSAHQAGLGCYNGRFHLKASPTSAGKGQRITLFTSGKWPVSDTFHNVGTDSYGLLGISSDGKFVAKYHVAAIAPGVRGPNIPVGGSNALSSVGLPNRPFQIQVPPVGAGRYIVTFDYVVTPDGGGKPKMYDLCAPLTVTTN